MKRLICAIAAIAMLLVSCGAEKYAAKAGEYKISEEEIRFYYNTIKSQMSQYIGDDSWTEQEIEGKPAAVFAKDKAFDQAVLNVAYISVFESLGLELNDEDKANIEAVKENLITGYGSEEALKSFLAQNDLDMNFVDMLCKSSACCARLMELALQENPVDEEFIQAEYQTMLDENVYRKAKHILIVTTNPDTGVSLTDEEKLEAEKKAQDIYNRAKNGEDFDTLMNEYSEDPGLASYPDGYVFTDGEMVTEFQDGVDSIGYDELTLVESDFGYHIIKRLKPELADLESIIADTAEAAVLDAAMTQWREETGFEVVRNDEVYDAIE